MNLEYVGAEQSFTVLAGSQPEYELEFRRDEVPVSVRNVTFDGLLVSADGRRQMVHVDHVSEEENVLRVAFPFLPEPGCFDYEIAYTTEQGSRYRLAFGKLEALSTKLDLEQLEELERDTRRVVVHIPDAVGGHVQLLWRAGLNTTRALTTALAAAKKLEGVDDTLGNLKAQVEEFRVFVAKWNENISSVLVMNPVTGTIWVGGRDTGQRYRGEDGLAPRVNSEGYWETYDGTRWNTLPYKAIGKDGLDGTAVRRIVVPSYADIPQEGEMCNGGVLYYVPTGEEQVTRRLASLSGVSSVDNYTGAGVLVFSPGRNWTSRGGSLRRFGLMAGDTRGGEPSEELLFAHLYYEESGAWWYAGRSTNNVAQVPGQVSWWDFSQGQVAPQLCRVKVCFTQGTAEPRDADLEQLRVLVAPIPSGEGSSVAGVDYCAQAFWQSESRGSLGYDVYAWVEPAGWIKVDEKYDLATEEVYGLMRYATDVTVDGGAPVGRDAAGHARVPKASSTVPGTILLSSAEVSNIGGRVHISVSGTLLVDVATAGKYGTVKFSSAVVVETNNAVGLNASGDLDVRTGRPGQRGILEPGSYYNQLTEIPYLVSVGVDARGRLAICGVPGGALRHMQPAQWMALKKNGSMVWIADDAFPVDGAHYLGLMTTAQFNQVNGLELNSASSSLLAGVYLAPGLEETRMNAVLPAPTAVEHFAQRKDVYDKETADGRFMTTQGGCLSVHVCSVDEDLPPANEMQKGCLYLAR